MPVRKIQFAPGEFYHIFNRGNARHDIFHNDKDKYRFLQAAYISNNANCPTRIFGLEMNKSGYTLAEIKKVFDDNKIIYDPLVRICADCLMENHFHFLLQEIKENGIVDFMQRLGTSYGKYFTIKYDRPGSLFQGRFKAVTVETDGQLRYLLAYINAINPAQIVEPELKKIGIKNFNRAWEKVNNYKWSTHFEFAGKRESILIDKGLPGELYPTPEEYLSFIKDTVAGISANKDHKIWDSIGDLTLE